MKVKKLLVAALMLVAAVSYGQTYSPNVITTGVPFVSINPDSRGGAMGDCGVATSADIYSMHYNPAKYVYLEDKFAGGLGYSPWLRNLVSDMGLAYLALGYKINDRSAVAGTLRYFSPGKIEFRDQYNQSLGEYTPNEWAIDATYSRMLGDYVRVFPWLPMWPCITNALLSGSATWMPTFHGALPSLTLVVRSPIMLPATVVTSFRPPCAWVRA